MITVTYKTSKTNESQEFAALLSKHLIPLITSDVSDESPGIGGVIDEFLTSPMIFQVGLPLAGIILQIIQIFRESKHITTTKKLTFNINNSKVNINLNNYSDENDLKADLLKYS